MKLIKNYLLTLDGALPINGFEQTFSFGSLKTIRSVEAVYDPATTGVASNIEVISIVDKSLNNSFSTYQKRLIVMQNLSYFLFYS